MHIPFSLYNSGPIIIMLVPEGIKIINKAGKVSRQSEKGDGVMDAMSLQLIYLLTYFMLGQIKMRLWESLKDPCAVQSPQEPLLKSTGKVISFSRSGSPPNRPPISSPAGYKHQLAGNAHASACTPLPASSATAGWRSILGQISIVKWQSPW